MAHIVRTRVVIALVASMSVVTSSDVHAQPDSETPACTASATECGRLVFRDGVGAYEKGDYEKSLTHFRRAYALKPHPVILFNLALAETKTGEWIEALVHFDEVVASRESGAELRAKAAKERDLAEKHVAYLSMDPGQASGAVVSIDGRTVKSHAAKLRVNPGAHRIEIRMAGKPTLVRELNVVPGETLRVIVDRPKEPEPSPRAQASEQPPSTRETNEIMHRKQLPVVWFYAAAGTTALMGFATVWSGIDTLSAHRDYERAFPTLSQQQINQRVDEGHGKETRTNVLLGVTGAFAAGTVVLGIFGTRWKAHAPATARIDASPGGVWVTGQF